MTPTTPSSPVSSNISTTAVTQSQNKINEFRPKTKLKQLHWHKLNNIDNTFWQDIEESELSKELLRQGVFEEIEKLFAASLPKLKKLGMLDSNGNPTSSSSSSLLSLSSTAATATGATTTSAEMRKVSILSRDLAQEFGINLHMYSNDSVEKFVSKVLRCSLDITENISVIEFFNSDAMNEISDTLTKKFKPYSLDFLGDKKEPEKDPNELERADRIFLELSFNLRHYWRARSRALLFTQTYAKDDQDLKQKLRNIDRCCTVLKESESIRNVLGVLKVLGNFMNEASKQAHGFKLETLQRLKLMKDELNSMSFLHHLEKILRQSFPDFCSFVDDLSVLNDVQNLSLDQLELDCNEMTKSVKIITDAMEKGKLSRKSELHPSDRILTVIANPMQKAKERIALLQTHLKRTMAQVASLMTYFGEDPSNVGSRDSFFAKFVTFVDEFKKAHIENVQKEEELKIYEARKKKIQNNIDINESKKKSNEVNENIENIENIEDNEDKNFVDSVEESSAVIDSLMAKLRADTKKGFKGIKDRETRRARYKLMNANSVTPTSTNDDIDANTVTVVTKPVVLLAEIDSNVAEPIEYKSVNNLKRRMTSRRKNAPDVAAFARTDLELTRAQTMLYHLRKENILAGTENISIDEETKKKKSLQ
ncbi:hypothetical protein LELG_00052 [Lodderomyces elongisporus NRRL YB-4239]|uniref:FH2 domain-containing protein n=1 Tax=Lodderomyces elongisporus (strain ATCC 11503 / CBS 2605 / JCM 1781 / NBRC 1676 / NRRL YB-4239) TaxID=379508 RepID=A5DRR6_LODEL|nr:hypothetical protein LELG_00052 [Lodderomyces elongisporus NRRL YB-4239]